MDNGGQGGISQDQPLFRVFKGTGLAGTGGTELLKLDNNGNLTVAGTISGSSITTTDIDGGSF